jgi:hypothetical protein
MKSTKPSRGRPLDNDTPVLEYTQEFKDYTGIKYKWIWDKVKFPNGVMAVEIFDPQFAVSEKLLRELELLEKKYEVKDGGRKPRITKDDKQRMEQIEKELEEFHYSIYPEDKPKIKIRKTKK